MAIFVSFAYGIPLVVLFICIFHMGYIHGLVVNFGNSPELSINSLVKESTHFPFSYLPYLTTKFNFEKAIIIDESYM